MKVCDMSFSIQTEIIYGNMEAFCEQKNCLDFLDKSKRNYTFGKASSQSLNCA